MFKWETTPEEMLVSSGVVWIIRSMVSPFEKLEKKRMKLYCHYTQVKQVPP